MAACFLGPQQLAAGWQERGVWQRRGGLDDSVKPRGWLSGRLCNEMPVTVRTWPGRLLNPVALVVSSGSSSAQQSKSAMGAQSDRPNGEYGAENLDRHSAGTWSRGMWQWDVRAGDSRAHRFRPSLDTEETRREWRQKRVKQFRHPQLLVKCEGAGC